MGIHRPERPWSGRPLHGDPFLRSRENHGKQSAQEPYSASCHRRVYRAGITPRPAELFLPFRNSSVRWETSRVRAHDVHRDGAIIRSSTRRQICARDAKFFLPLCPSNGLACVSLRECVLPDATLQQELQYRRAEIPHGYGFRGAPFSRRWHWRCSIRAAWYLLFSEMGHLPPNRRLSPFSLYARRSSQPKAAVHHDKSVLG